MRRDRRPADADAGRVSAGFLSRLLPSPEQTAAMRRLATDEQAIRRLEKTERDLDYFGEVAGAVLGNL
jgi:hypothetical protein